MQDQAVMESQNTCGTEIVALTSNFMFPAIKQWLNSQLVNGKIKHYKKAVILQRWPRDASYIWVPWKFLNVHRKFEMRSLSRSWDNSD